MRTVVPVAAVAALITSFDVRPRGDGVAVTGSPAAPAAADCSDCHVAIDDEWRESRHAHAWTNPVYQTALRDLAHPERCHGCHAPKPVLARLGRPPRARSEDRHAGVTCRSCHASRGKIAGPFGAATSAHESEQHPVFSEAGSVHLCGSCHDLQIGPVLPLARDFAAAGLADRGKSCIGCHMPNVRRPMVQDPVTGEPGPVRSGRSHELRGPSDPAFCAEAFKIGVTRDADRLELAVGNRAGHRVPGLTTRRFRFEVAQVDDTGTRVSTGEVVLSAENPLFVAETRRFRWRIAPSTIAVEVTVFHEHGDRRSEIVRERYDL